MMRKLTCYCSAAALVAGASLSGAVMADEARIAELEERIEALEASPATGDGIRFGGALRFNVRYDDTDAGSAIRDRGGDINLDTFRINVDGRQDRMTFAAEYRWYPDFDQHFLHTGWVGYDFTDHTTARIGQQRAAFGLQPYQSNNFWFSSNYYVGLEDKLAIGINVDHQKGPFDLDIGFFSNPASGSAGSSGHYSTEVAPAADCGAGADAGLCNEEMNQLYARAAYTFDHGADASTEFGISGMAGKLRNTLTGDRGDSWAAAAHLNGQYQRWNVMAQFASYEHDPRNPDGANDDILNMSIQGFTGFGTPAEADTFILNVAYDLPVSFGPVSNLRFYNDYSTVRSKSDSSRNTEQNVTGMSITAGNIFTYVDIIRGKNQPFVGGQTMVGDDGSWETLYNINIGYYF